MRPSSSRGALALCLLGLLALGPGGCVRPRAGHAPDDPALAAQAGALVRRGSYAALKEACAILEGVHQRARQKEATRERLVKTALLLALREKELAIDATRALDTAAAAVAECPACADLQQALAIVTMLPVRHRGVAGDDTNLRPERVWERRDQINAWSQFLETRQADEFWAYLVLALESEYAYAIRRHVTVSELLAAHPGSALLASGAALRHLAEPAAAAPLLAADPAFAEVHFLQGLAALDGRGKMTGAEAELDQARQALPGSAAVWMASADLGLARGDLDMALEDYGKVLQLAARHRQAHLRRAICLSLLQRHEAALAGLFALVGLGGGYLPAETEYWLAWNQMHLDRLDEAQQSIARARRLDTGNSQIYVLAGQIAYRLTEIKEAESNFREAVARDTSACEAFFGLGAIDAGRARWTQAAGVYEKALACQAAAAATLGGRLAELRQADLPEARKLRIASALQKDLDELLLAKATSAYDAAACYLNAGVTDRAAELAEVAAEHFSYAVKAQVLIEKARRK